MTDDSTDSDAVMKKIETKAFEQMGWAREDLDAETPNDDVRLIRSALPTIVDITLDEVIDVLNAQAVAANASTDVPAVQYTHEVRTVLLDSPGKSIRIQADDVERAARTWRGDPRFTVTETPQGVYVRAGAERDD